MKSIIGIAAILVAAISVSTRADAAPQYRPPRIVIRPQPAPPPNPAGKRYVEMDYPTPEKRAANLAQLLSLSNEQRDKVKDIFVEQEKQTSVLWADELLTTDARVKRLGEVRMAAVKKIREILTDEQRKKYDSFDDSTKPADKPRLQPDPNSGPLL